MFHVELRQFPHVARSFNLTTEELQTRIIVPWLAGKMVECGDRRWAPERARLTIYEGPKLRPDEIGLGRGWGSATRTGVDVTEPLLTETEQAPAADPSLDLLMQQILGRCAAGRIEVRETVALADSLHPAWRVSERIALAERSVWQLLEGGLLRLTQGGPGSSALARDQWGALLLAWSTWADPTAAGVFLEATSG